MFDCELGEEKYEQRKELLKVLEMEMSFELIYALESDCIIYDVDGNQVLS